MIATPPAKPPIDAGRRPGFIKRMYHWVLHWAETPYGTPALFALSFAESSFFPIPPDVLQIALSVSKPRRSFYYAAVSVVASVLGAILGWYIGYALWSGIGQSVMNHFGWLGFTPENFALVESKYAEYGFLAILVAAFSPIPYKVFTIAAGIFSFALPMLVLASVLGRSARFFSVAACIYAFGPSVKALIEKYFELATILFTVLLIGGIVLIKFLI
jgi:membrane protein YqaA with SNARE-associated domain